MASARAEVLLNWMMVVEIYTLSRALDGLTQAEFDWEPHPGGSPGSEWVVDNDYDLAEAADRGEAVEPMTTIGWLLNHFGGAPGGVAELEIVGGSKVPTMELYQQMWGYTVLPTVDEAVARFKDGWSALDRAPRTTADEGLERDFEGHLWTHGHLAVSAMLNEVSHHGTQICMLRDLYAHRGD